MIVCQCVCVCACRGRLAVQLSGWLQRRPSQTPCSCQAQLAGEPKCALYLRGLTHTLVCSCLYTHAEFYLDTLFFFSFSSSSFLKSKKSAALCPSRWHVSSRFHVCVQRVMKQLGALLISLTPWPLHPVTNPPLAGALPKTKQHTHAQWPVNSVSLCSLPYTCRLLEELEDCGWVLCLLIGWWQTNQASQKYTRKKKRMRDRGRGRSPGGWVAHTPIEVFSSSFSCFSLFLIFFFGGGCISFSSLVALLIFPPVSMCVYVYVLLLHTTVNEISLLARITL